MVHEIHISTFTGNHSHIKSIISLPEQREIMCFHDTDSSDELVDVQEVFPGFHSLAPRLVLST